MGKKSRRKQQQPQSEICDQNTLDVTRAVFFSDTERKPSENEVPAEVDLGAEVDGLLHAWNEFRTKKDVSLQDVADMDGRFKAQVARLEPLGTALKRSWMINSAKLSRCRDRQKAAQLSEIASRMRKKQETLNSQCNAINEALSQFQQSPAYLQCQEYIKQAYVKVADGSFIKKSDLKQDEDELEDFDTLLQREKELTQRNRNEKTCRADAEE